MELALAQEIYKTRPNREEIDLAIRIEEETRYYTERFLQSDLPDFHNRDFLPWARSRLNNDQSYTNFQNALTFPVTTAQFIDDIYSKLARIWEAQNPFYKIEVKDSEETLKFDWWKTTGWNLLKIKHNCILFIDLPEEQEGDTPKPYLNILPIEKCIDVSVKDNVISHIMFMYKGNVIVIDEKFYQIFTLNTEKTEIAAEFKSTPNILGYCPAFFLSNIKYQDKYEIPRINPLTNSLGKFRNLLFLDTLKDITDPYAFYMFVSKYNSSANCDFNDGEKHCVDGLLYQAVESSETSDGYNKPVYENSGPSGKSIAKCPKCNKNLGYGQVVTLPIPTDSADKAIPTPIQFVAPPKDLLEWRNTYLKGLYSDLAAFVVGNDQELNPKMNHNETAYRYNLEGMQAILMRWKGVFEAAIKSTVDAELTIKHGSAFTGSHIDLGSDFLLLDVQDLYDEKKSANELGLGTVLNFNERIIETKYKNNPDLKLRAKIINAFKPFDDTMGNIENSFKGKLISKKDYFRIKYLDQFINWFEMEKNKIAEIGKKGEKEAIKQMNDAFIEFYNIKIAEEETKEAAPPVVPPVIEGNV